MFTFNDEYLLKSMMSLVRDESDRIVSLGLASREELRNFIEPALHAAITRVAENQEDKSVVLGTLTDLHSGLNQVRLPGDFKKISGPITQYLCAVLEIDIPVEVNTDEAQQTATDTEDQEEEIKDESSYDDETLGVICSFLEKLTYELGKKGNHEAAYLVERTTYKIAALAQKQ